MLRKQLLGGLGAACAILVVMLIWAFQAHIPSAPPPADDPASRLAYATRWLVLPGLTLVAGIFAASRRGFFADAIEGTRTPANHNLEIALRYNQNTVEQLILAGIAWLALSVTLPHERLPLIAIMAVLFVIGRVTFWVGYVLHPMGRTFGMTLTVIPTLAAYGWLTWRGFGQGF